MIRDASAMHGLMKIQLLLFMEQGNTTTTNTSPIVLYMMCNVMACV